MIPYPPSRHLYIVLSPLFWQIIYIVQLPRVKFIPPVLIRQNSYLKIRRTSCKNFESVPVERLHEWVWGCGQGFCVDAVDTKSVVWERLSDDFMRREFIGKFDWFWAAEGFIRHAFSVSYQSLLICVIWSVKALHVLFLAAVLAAVGVVKSVKLVFFYKCACFTFIVKANSAGIRG